MVVIRFSRIGTNKKPIFRIVAADSRRPRDGKYLENLGTYDPVKNRMIGVKKGRIEQWLKVGAQPSETVQSVLKKFL